MSAAGYHTQWRSTFDADHVAGGECHALGVISPLLRLKAQRVQLSW